MYCLTISQTGSLLSYSCKQMYLLSKMFSSLTFIFLLSIQKDIHVLQLGLFSLCLVTFLKKFLADTCPFGTTGTLDMDFW